MSETTDLADVTIIPGFCPRHGKLHDGPRQSCSDTCSSNSSSTYTEMAPAAIATTVAATRPQYDGFGLIGALDEWVRWSA